jgi:hypothetical protein
MDTCSCTASKSKGVMAGGSDSGYRARLVQRHFPTLAPQKTLNETDRAQNQVWLLPVASGLRTSRQVGSVPKAEATQDAEG